jgi:hypothetical protein
MKVRHKIWEFVIYSCSQGWRFRHSDEWVGTQRIYRSYSFGPFVLRIFDRFKEYNRENPN